MNRYIYVSSIKCLAEVKKLLNGFKYTPSVTDSTAMLLTLVDRLSISVVLNRLFLMGVSKKQNRISYFLK
jgi:hypothetical protein